MLDANIQTPAWLLQITGILESLKPTHFQRLGW